MLIQVFLAATLELVFLALGPGFLNKLHVGLVTFPAESVHVPCNSTAKLLLTDLLTAGAPAVIFWGACLRDHVEERVLIPMRAVRILGVLNIGAADEVVGLIEWEAVLGQL